jgi:serralysin
VTYQTADGTAAAGADYAPTNGSLTFSPGTTSQTVTVAVFGDSLNEANETFFVDLGFALNATFSDSRGQVTIGNDDPLPTLAIGDATVMEGNSGTSDANFTVSLSAVSGQTVTVNYVSAAGTGGAGDFIATNGTATFPPGTTSRTVTVKVLGELLNEPDETFFVNLSGAANAIISDAQGDGLILNDDPLPTLSIGDVTIAEGNSGTINAVFTISLSTASGRTLSVNFATANLAQGGATAGSDYLATNGIVTFPTGTSSRTIAVALLGDGLNEDNESFFVNLSNPTNAVIADGQAVGTINNDDPLPGIVISNVTLAEGNTGATNAVFTVSLSAASGRTVTVIFSTTNGTAVAGGDYASTNGLVTFVPGTTNQNVAVAVLGDLSYETGESFLVNLSNPTNATISDGQGVGTINNDDSLPTISISNVAVFEGNSGTINAAFSVNLSAASGLPVTVNYATADGTARRQDNDFERITSTQLQINPGQTNQLINVIVNGDTSVETNEAFFVNLTSPVNGTLVDSQAVGTILNDDGVPSLSITDVTLVEGNAGTTNAVFAVRLSSSYSQVVSVNYATAGGSAAVGTDFLATNGVVSFPSGSTNQSIAVRIIGDLVSETNETLSVILSSSINALISDSTGLATILDNDPISFLLSTNAITVAEGGTNAFSVRLQSAPASNVSVTTTRTSGSTNLNVLAGGALTFTPVNWNVFQPVVIGAAPDADSINESATFAVSTSGSTQFVTVTGLDGNPGVIRIVGVELAGADVVIRFTTAPNRNYRVEWTDALGGNPWIAVDGTVAGTGGVVPVTDLAGASQARRFYRVLLLPL